MNKDKVEEQIKRKTDHEGNILKLLENTVLVKGTDLPNGDVISFILQELRKSNEEQVEKARQEGKREGVEEGRKIEREVNRKEEYNIKKNTLSDFRKFCVKRVFKINEHGIAVYEMELEKEYLKTLK